jgi:AcrR family transcriptional regulator
MAPHTSAAPEMSPFVSMTFPLLSEDRDQEKTAARTAASALAAEHAHDMLASARLYSRACSQIFFDLWERRECAAKAGWHAIDPLNTLGSVGRHKAISDQEVVRVARELFRAQGHTVSTREVAEAAGISEATLYQRFGSKDDLFFAAMHPRGPDIDALLGPDEPPEDAHMYLQGVVVRIGKYFAEVIPLALRVMTHPSFDPGSLARAQPTGAAVLQQALVARLASLVRRKRIVMSSEAMTARVLVSLAHDWALGGVLSPGNRPHRERELKDMVDVVWQGLEPR